jgi:hypothetical protein
MVKALSSVFGSVISDLHEDLPLLKSISRELCAQRREVRSIVGLNIPCVSGTKKELYLVNIERCSQVTAFVTCTELVEGCICCEINCGINSFIC